MSSARSDSRAASTGDTPSWSLVFPGVSELTVALQGRLFASGNPVERLTFQNSAICLHAVAAGPEDGPVVVLLHGFPEFWYGWRKQMDPLAAAGFRVIVPDQ